MKKCAIITLIFAFHCTVKAQLSATQIDALAEKTLAAFDVPGIAIAVGGDSK